MDIRNSLFDINKNIYSLIKNNEEIEKKFTNLNENYQKDIKEIYTKLS